jgi:hypothetical protein
VAAPYRSRAVYLKILATQFMQFRSEPAIFHLAKLARLEMMLEDVSS